MTIATIIVAAGAGHRMGGEMPKQFVAIKDRVILMRTIENFAYLSGEIVVVLSADRVDFWRNLCSSEHFNVPHTVVAGGSKRLESVRRGLAAVSADAELILVQDGVRPFADRELIDRVVRAAAENGAVVPAVPVTDSLRSSGGAISREGIFAVQTPQGFHADILHISYNKEQTEEKTDDAAVVEAAGFPITIVEGDPRNIKITTPTDLKIGELLC